MSFNVNNVNYEGFGIVSSSSWYLGKILASSLHNGNGVIVLHVHIITQ